MLHKLVQQKKEGGYGLAFKFFAKDYLRAALKFNQAEMLEVLIKPINEGGYGLLPKKFHVHGLLMESKHNFKCFKIMLHHMLNNLLTTTSIDEVLKWASGLSVDQKNSEALSSYYKQKNPALLTESIYKESV